MSSTPARCSRAEPSALRELLGGWDLFAVLLWAELKQSAVATRIGVIWWFLDPLITAAIFYFVVHGVFERGAPDYHLFVVAGLLGWQWFARSLNAAAAAFTSAGSMLSRTRVPLLLLIVVPVVANAVYFLIGLLTVKLIAGTAWRQEDLWVLPIVLLQALLSVGLGALVATAAAYVADVRRALGFVLRAWWFMCPVLYEVERVLGSAALPSWLKTLYLYNPMVGLLPGYHAFVLHRPWPPLEWLWSPAIAAAVTLGMAVLLLRGSGRHFLKYS